MLQKISNCWFLLLVIALAAGANACNDDSEGSRSDASADADTDSDTDADTDADADTDTDADTDADAGTDADSGADADFVADHTAVTGFDSIPPSVRADVKALNIAYWHTSHGSQLVSGVNYQDEMFSLSNLDDRGSPDLGSSTWEVTTTAHLDSAAGADVDVVIWSWCGQASTDIDMDSHYLSKMATLESAYPDVTFIYMTGHLRGAYNEYLYDTETNQRLQTNNGEIRTHCETNDSWLFDFADIESYLDGSTEQCTYEDMPVECTWPEEPTFSCAHSVGANCVRKGKAFWWLLARITGWND